MSACVVWLDSEHARIFKITNQGVKKTSLEHHENHPIGAHHDNHVLNAREKFYHNVAKEIGKVEELLIFGAGMAKMHFKSHLEKHHHSDLVQQLVGVETLDNLTDNQVLEAARKYFKKFNLYNSSI